VEQLVDTISKERLKEKVKPAPFVDLLFLS